MTKLCWRHHTLVQMLLSRGPIREADFRSIFYQITGKSSASQQQKLFNEYLRKINEELSYVQFELRACRNQYDGNVHYGVVNNVSDEQSKLGTKYTVPQIVFYKGVVEAIIQDAEASGSISNTDALYIRLETQVSGTTGSQSQGGSSQVPTALKNFSMSQKEKTLEQLVKDKWLSLTPDGNIGLGVRSFLDLRSWFRSNDVPACEVCNEAAIKAQHCQNGACKVRLHQYCLEQKFAQQRVERVCPGCGTQWPGSIARAEAAREEDEPNDVPSQSTQPSRGKRQRSYRETDAESDSFQTSVPDSKRVTRSSSQLHVN